jgi:hypothetical protein
LANDTQATELAAKNNSFDDESHIRCFNHTMQVSVKALLKPFHKGITNADDKDAIDNLIAEDNVVVDDTQDDDMFLQLDNEDDQEVDGVDDEQCDAVDEMADLDEEEHEKLLEDTAVVRETIAKVHMWHFMSFLYTDALLQDSKTCFPHCSLHDHCTPHLALCLYRPQAQAKFDTSRRCHTLELHSRHVKLRIAIPRAHQQCDGR